jgi:multiple sugar transport system substrate-binding protein
MDLPNKSTTRQSENLAGSDGASASNESIFENVVAEKYPNVINAPVDSQSDVPFEEIPADVESPREVGRPAPEILDNVPSSAGSDSRHKYIFVGSLGIFFIIVLLLLIFVFRAIRKPESTVSSVPVTLTYWGMWEDESVLKPVFDEYIKLNPHVTISYDKRSPQEYLTRLLGRSPNGKGPDIFRFHNTWINQLTGGILSPIPNEIMTPTQFEETFYKVQSEDLKVDGKYFGIPTYIDGIVMIYNPAMLKAVGYSSPPTTFVGDMIEMAKDVTVSGDNGPITAGIAIGTSNNIEHFSDIFGIIVLLDNLQSQKDVSNAWANLRIFREFAEQGLWSESMPSSIDAFAQEKVAMIFAPTWQIPIIRSKNPDLRFASAPVPQGLSGNRLTLATYWAEGVSRYSKSQSEAWKLVKYMSEKSSQEKIFEMQKKSRGMGMAYSRKDMKSLLQDDPDLGPLLAYSDAMVSIPINDRTFDEGLNDGIVEYLSKAISDSAKGVSYTSAFSQAGRGIRDLFENKYKIDKTK